jgi:hypothetical protein
MTGRQVAWRYRLPPCPVSRTDTVARSASKAPAAAQPRLVAEGAARHGVPCPAAKRNFENGRRRFWTITWHCSQRRSPDSSDDPGAWRLRYAAGQRPLREGIGAGHRPGSGRAPAPARRTAAARVRTDLTCEPLLPNVSSCPERAGSPAGPTCFRGQLPPPHQWWLDAGHPASSNPGEGMLWVRKVTKHDQSG